MILFHVATLDLDEPDVRARAWLPSRLLRQAGVPARLVEGDVSRGVVEAARCVVLAGPPSDCALTVSRQAQRAGVPVVLDAGGSVDVDREKAFTELAHIATVTTASNTIAARHVRGLIGAAEILVVPDPIDSGEGLVDGVLRHPKAAGHLIARRIAGYVRDAARGFWRQSHAKTDTGRKTIVWFGGASVPNDAGGVAELLLAASDLADLADEVPVRIEIVGKSRRDARRLLKHLRIPMTFYHYAPSQVRARLRKADLCVLPSEASSARAAWALASGVPVVPTATDTPWLLTMRAALTNPAGQAPGALDIIHEHAAPAVTSAWRNAIGKAQAATKGQRLAADIVATPARRLRVLLLLQQFQDIDLIVPIAEAASASPDLDVRVAVLSKIAVSAARRLRATIRNGARIEFWHGPDLLRNRIAPTCFAVDVALTASEGSNFGGRFARAFVIASRAAGARALTLQHGVDNGGLTYGRTLPASEFQSDLILTWGGPERLSDAACAETRAKVVPVGCPKRAFSRGDFKDFPGADRRFIAIFENLHWKRYSDEYRAQFVRDVTTTAASSPDLHFVLKPHMGGQWFTRGGHGAGALPANLTIADPTSPQWRRFTADAFLAHASAVITTPSTIALDAARYQVPAALATYGIAAENYAPLPRLERSEDWLAFVDEVRRGSYEDQRLAQFLADATIGGDAVARILAVIRMAGTRQSHAEILSAEKVAAS
jgi:hypothetical protein